LFQSETAEKRSFIKLSLGFSGDLVTDAS